MISIIKYPLTWLKPYGMKMPSTIRLLYILRLKKYYAKEKDDWGWMLPMPIYQNIIFTTTKTLQCFTLIRCMILQTN